jgi:hypothetical protein
MDAKTPGLVVQAREALLRLSQCLRPLQHSLQKPGGFGLERLAQLGPGFAPRAL